MDTQSCPYCSAPVKHPSRPRSTYGVTPTTFSCGTTSSPEWSPPVRGRLCSTTFTGRAKCMNDENATGEHGLCAGKFYEVRPAARKDILEVFIDGAWRNGYEKHRFHFNA
jgi:hypothetical protein